MVQNYIFYLSFLALACFISAIILGRRERRNELALYINKQMNVSKNPYQKNILILIKKYISSRIQLFIPDEEKTLKLLLRARVNSSVTDFYLTCLLLAALFLVLSLILLFFFSNLSWIKVLIFSFLLAYCGYQMPKFYVIGKALTRQKKAAQEVLTYARILAIITSAGSDILNALKRIGKYSNGVLAEEFAVALQEISSGKRKSQALLDMSKRLEVKDLTLLIEAIVDAEKTGAPLAKILRDQAKRINESIRNKAVGDAGKASVKLLGPLLLCIFPALLIFMFGPVVIQFTNVF